MADPDKTPIPPAEQPAKTRKTAPKLKHLDGCPADPDRVEQYDTERHNRDHSLTPYAVTRCKDCGAHEAKPK